jgi:hypothetical protein
LVLAAHLDWLALLDRTVSSGKADPETEEVFDSTAEVDEATELEDGTPLLTDTTDVALDR